MQYFGFKGKHYNVSLHHRGNYPRKLVIMQVFSETDNYQSHREHSADDYNYRVADFSIRSGEMLFLNTHLYTAPKEMLQGLMVAAIAYVREFSEGIEGLLDGVIEVKVLGNVIYTSAEGESGAAAPDTDVEVPLISAALAILGDDTAE